jgi:hypothetical protein
MKLIQRYAQWLSQTNQVPTLAAVGVQVFPHLSCAGEYLDDLEIVETTIQLLYQRYEQVVDYRHQ